MTALISSGRSKTRVVFNGEESVTASTKHFVVIRSQFERRFTMASSTSSSVTNGSEKLAFMRNERVPQQPVENAAAVEIEKHDFHRRLEKPARTADFSTFPTGSAAAHNQKVLPMSRNMCYPSLRSKQVMRGG